MEKPIKKQHELSPPGIYKHVFPFAKANRKTPTAAEEKLWKHLRNRQVDGFKFRRQHVIDKYIPDFVCIDPGLIVETDGGYHENQEQREYDAQREVDLKRLGFETIRFTNEEVLNQIEAVVEKICVALHALRKKADAKE